MCGIAGFELRGGDEQTAARLLERLAWRGPDAGWFTPTVPYGLVQTRLAIIDLSERVRYPLRSESGQLHLLFNGEVYEYQRHRAELEHRGHRFSTDCDAEVVLHGYEEWGMDLFPRLDGMFAVALFHAPSQELVLVRDALGIKPLVYTTDRPFAFSSDALSLVAAGLSSGTIDETLVADYLAFHYLAPPSTGLRDIEQLVPGEALRRSADGRTAIERWRRRPFCSPASLAPIETQEAEIILDRAVRRQLVADVPVGVFLSSGLDSSLVLDSAVRAGARPTAFTIGFPGHGRYDEVPSAERLAHELGVPHVVGELSGGFAETIDLVAGAFDAPFADASAIATLQLSRLARDRVTVVLSGTGGDDLFAGYYRHRVHLFTALLGHFPAGLARLATPIRARGRERRSALALGRAYLARMAAIRGKDPLSQYLEIVGSCSSGRAAEVMRDRVPSLAEHESFAGRLGERTALAGSVLRGIQAFELETYLPGDLLTKEDRATMAVGLEARVPLLGTELLDLAERTPDRQKIGVLEGKRLLRDIARHRLPSYVTRRRKLGFAVPLADFLSGPWRAEALEWFAESSSSLIDGPAVSTLLKEGKLPATDAWALAALVGWEGSVRNASRATNSHPASVGLPSVVMSPGARDESVRKPHERDELRVLATTAYPDVAAGARVRIVEMGAHLQPLGIRVDFRPSMTNGEYRAISTPGISARKAAAVARALVRASHIAPGRYDSLTLVHRLRSLIPPLDDDGPIDVYDFDDAIYLGSAFSHAAWLASLKREPSRCLRYMRNARLVLAGNAVLADEAREHAARVEIVPSCVDPTLQRVRRHRDADVLTLGWIGSRTTSAYLRPVLDAIDSLQARGRPVRLVVIGAEASPDAPWIEHRPWSVEAERQLLTEIDVGVMPLPDDAWARGKCGYKLLRYFSAGLPTIASPVGVNAQLIAGGHGLSATTPPDWSRAIEELADDAIARQQIGDEARRFVEREYSYQVWAPRVAGLLRELAR